MPSRQKPRPARRPKRNVVRRKFAGHAEANQFAAAMAEFGVRRMSQKKLADTKAPKPRPVALNLGTGEDKTPESQLSDLLDATIFLETEDGRMMHRKGVSPDIPRKLYRGEWPVEGRNRSARHASGRSPGGGSPLHPREPHARASLPADRSRRGLRKSRPGRSSRHGSPLAQAAARSDGVRPMSASRRRRRSSARTHHTATA